MAATVPRAVGRRRSDSRVPPATEMPNLTLLPDSAMLPISVKLTLQPGSEQTLRHGELNATSATTP
jgi:hypothetical protein